MLRADLLKSRVKVRWGAGKTSGGWRDLMLNLVINDIVFEVQIVLSALLGARTVLDAHKAYNQFRSFIEVFDLLDISPEFGRGNGGVRISSSSSLEGGDDIMLVESLRAENVRLVMDLERERGRVAIERAAFKARIAELEAEVEHLRNM